jgi:hypothetical protein
MPPEARSNWSHVQCRSIHNPLNRRPSVEKVSVRGRRIGRTMFNHRAKKAAATTKRAPIVGNSQPRITATKAKLGNKRPGAAKMMAKGRNGQRDVLISISGTHGPRSTDLRIKLLMSAYLSIRPFRLRPLPDILPSYGKWKLARKVGQRWRTTFADKPVNLCVVD